MRLKDLNRFSLPALFRELGGPEATRRLALAAREEDLGPGRGPGDVTSLVATPVRGRATATLRARENGVLAGFACVPELLRVFSKRTSFRALRGMRDGARIRPGRALATLNGPARDILVLERTLLNLLCRLSGIATRADVYRREMTKHGAVRAQLFDTRKTTPGMRALEKYAVRCGGGRCHRVGLFDAVLIKDNHIANVPVAELPGWVERAAARAAQLGVPLRFFEVEVDSMAQLARVLSARRPGRSRGPAADVVLLDNMRPEMLRRAVRMRDRLAPGVLLEASGGVDLSTIAGVARCGVDRISVGALTHSAPIVDIGLDFSHNR